MPVLTAAFEAADEGAVCVIGGHHRVSALRPRGWRSCNLWTQFGRIIERAGLKAWPRLFHNLRASRETELLSELLTAVENGGAGRPRMVAPGGVERS